MIDPTNPDYTNTPVAPQRPRFDYAPVEPLAPPCVTIVTPFYNTGPVFHETARSVLQQSMQQWEWLIIDDGSTEAESLAILAHYGQSDPRIRILTHKANRGQGAARNTGFRAARAACVVQLDSDDLLEPTAIEKWWWFLESYPEYAFVNGYSVAFGDQSYLWQHGFHNGNASLEENLIDNKSAIRKAAHHAVGGYDESIREGVEDWEFWLRCANHGYWGGTIPEYLAWYRRRPISNQGEADWHNPEWRRGFRVRLQQKYADLWNGKFPSIQLRWPMAYDLVSDVLPCENRLSKSKPHLLIIVPWLTFGGSDKFNLDLVEQLTKQEWKVTIATTLKADHSWLPLFARYTPDIFILHHFLRPVDHPRFLRYLIHSRQIDVVLGSHSELAYLLLPYLRAHCPRVAFVDFCHIEDENWRRGGYPHTAIEYQELLDLNIVVSEHLRQWMRERGADPQRVQKCYINVDTSTWRPDPERCAVVRRELGVDEAIPVVLYVGRICDQKQPRVLAQTILQLHQQDRNFIVLVAGDGPELGWLGAFVQREGLSSHVRLLGAVANERVRELMVAADIFFLPSKWEGIALSIYEAMACGLPIVGADVGGQRELVTPECGVLIPRSEEETEAAQYAQVLAGLLDNPTRRQEMGRAGRERVSTHFRLEQMGERMVGLLQEARRLHEESPRPQLSLGLGRACASQAVEYLRLAEVVDGLWRERGQGQNEGGQLHPHLLDPYSDSWRTLAYFTLRRLFLPYYRGALNRDVTWLLPLKNRLKRSLLGEDHL